MSAAFNTAQWNKSVSGYEWPGPKWMKENATILNNFTCYFKVRRFYSFTLLAFCSPHSALISGLQRTHSRRLASHEEVGLHLR